MKSVLVKSVVFLILIIAVGFSNLRAQSFIFRPYSVTVADLVIEEAMRYLGTPYRWGGQTPKGFDCAGFVKYIYSKFGLNLASGAAPQYRMGRVLKDEEISKGDLVFYGGRGSSKSIGHVGIVTSVDSTGFYFIHSATSTGISISHSKEQYYRSRYIGACRVVDKVVSNLPANGSPALNSLPVYRQFYFGETINYLHNNN